MIKILKKVTVPFLCVLIALPWEAYAQNTERGSAHTGQRIQEVYKQLKLTDDQKKQLEVNKQQHRSRVQAAHQQMKTAHEALQQELMKPQLDMAAINQRQAQIKALLAQMEDDKLSSILAVRGILTPEQFAKFVSLMHKNKQEHEQQEHDKE